MKRALLSCMAVVLMLVARADEGMWIPSLIGKNYDEMKRLGLKLSKDDLYSINHGSLKDAILQFAGGCTAEMISADGLLLTNHHCGYDAIATLSTVDRDLLDNGFWAHSKEEELPAQGVTALFLKQIIDVTDEVKAQIGNATGDEFNKKFDQIRKRIEDSAAQKGKYVANVKDYFNGNQFFLLLYKRYTDVRLVGAPPKSLGKFGGETDNWMWPRHTADFSMFRVYADSSNQPKAYAVTNVPYHPKKFLPISIHGEKEGDYAMIFGYPGRTTRYVTSQGIYMAINITNPSIVEIRDLRLNIIHSHMAGDKATYLQLTSVYARIANYWKYYIGQTEQLKRLHIVEQKQKEEAEFTAWEKANGGDANLIHKFDLLYDDYRPYVKHAVYYSECFLSSSLMRMAFALKPLYDYYEKNAGGTIDQDSVKKYLTNAKMARKSLMKEYDAGTEKELFAKMTELFYKNVSKDQLPDIYANVILKHMNNTAAVIKVIPGKGKKTTKPAATGYTGTTYDAYADYVFNNSFLADSVKFEAFCNAPSFEKLKNDAAVIHAMSEIRNYTANVQPRAEKYNNMKTELSHEYVGELMKWKKNNMFYPDANSTMRISYGKVLSYEPKDGVHYNYFTTLDGFMAKYKAGDEEFDAPQQLIDLYKKKDFGRYADKDGTLHTDFITNNDITGGNSGSPVINGNGELIGAAFDGNWEAMSGDIAFDKTYKRTIVCDIRWILFIVDKMGHADNLLKEMDIRE